MVSGSIAPKLYFHSKHVKMIPAKFKENDFQYFVCDKTYDF